MAHDPVLEAINGGAGSFVSKLITFPLDLIKTRCASSTRSPLEVASLAIEEHGALGLYQGLGPKLLKSVTAKVLYFFNYSVLANLARNSRGHMSPTRNLLVGYFAEIIELPVTMPLEAIATRVQLRKESSLSDAFNSLLAEGKLFVSLDACILGAFNPAVQNTIFDQLKATLRHEATVLESFFLGVIASAIAITLTYPLDFARTVAQSGRKHDEGKDMSMLAIWRRTATEHGVLGLFRGLTPSLLQGVLSAALMLAIKTKISDFNKALIYGRK